MSFLSGVKNFIKTEVLGIEETNVQTPVAQENIPVIQCKTEAPEDKYEKRTDVKTDKKIPQMSRKAMEENVNNIPSANLDIRKMVKNGLIEKVAGISKADFERMSPKEKQFLYTAIKFSIAKFDELKQQGKINPNASEEELIAAFGNVLYEALQNGDFKTAEEFNEAVGNVEEELGADFDKISEEEQKARLRISRKHIDEQYKKEREEIRKLPKNERSAAQMRLDRRFRHIRRGKLIAVSTEYRSESAINAIVLLDSADIQYGARMILKTRRDKEEMTRTADCADYEYQKGLIKEFKEAGDEVSAESLQGFTETFVEAKSAEAVNEFQKNYKADRDKYEIALKKQQNGESLTEEEKELLSTMQQEYYTATAKGIGQGALNNINMTTDEKAEFLNTWENDARQYSDYEAVVKDVREEINNNPEKSGLKEKIDKIKEKEIAKIKEENKGEQKTETVADSGEKKTPSVYATVPFAPKTSISKFDSETEPKVLEERKNMVTETPKQVTAPDTISRKNSVSKAIIADDIKVHGPQKAIETYGSKAIDVILNDKSFKHYRPVLTPIIRSYDVETLKKITTSCSDSTFLYICSIVNKDFIQEITENRVHTKGLCHAAKEQVENYIESEN